MNMELQMYKTLWGHQGTLAAAADQALASGCIGLEGNADRLPRAELRKALQSRGLSYIQEIVTAGGYVPRCHESVQEHLHRGQEGTHI